MKHSAQSLEAGDCAENDISGSITGIAMVHPCTSSLDAFVRAPTLKSNRRWGQRWQCVDTAAQVRFEATGNAVTAGTNGRKRMFLLPGARSSLNVREPPSGETDVSYGSPRQKSIPIRHETVESRTPEPHAAICEGARAQLCNSLQIFCLCDHAEGLAFRIQGVRTV
jgi:hypothetical protein